MTTMAMPVTAMTLRRHQSTGIVAPKNTGIIHGVWEPIGWTIDPPAMALSTWASVTWTLNCITRKPSTVRTPARA